MHASIGRTLDGLREEHYGETDGRAPAASLYSNVYRVFSNYVHGKFPETMDLYGGTPGRFHFHGMSGTSKDAENATTLEQFVTSSSNAFIRIVQCLDLHARIATEPELASWYQERVSV